jgi:RimJ/RimL family protein N-acetyltransferase
VERSSLEEHGVPARIETERLVLRCWSEKDASQLREAIEISLDHLRKWMPWAMAEPRSIEETRELLRGFESKFKSGEDFVYGVFKRDESEVIGGSGLHPRIGAGGLEIGYWIRVDRTREGYATETARALTEAGLGVPGMERIQIHCDPQNVGSRRVPEKLAFRLVETRVGDKQTSEGGLRDTLVFELRGDTTREG